MKNTKRHAWILRLAAFLSLWAAVACREGRELERQSGVDGASIGSGGERVDAGAADARKPAAGTGGVGATGGIDGAGGQVVGAGGMPGAGGAGLGGRGVAAGGTTGSGGAGLGGRGTTGSGGAMAPVSAASLSGTMSHAYGTLEVGVASAPFDWVIRNNGDQPTPPLSLVSDTATELINRTPSGCTAFIPGHGSCTLSIAFSPSALGERSGSYTIDGGAAGKVTLSASATGGYRVTVMKAGDGTGTVTSDSGGLDCGATCSFLLTGGTGVLTAQTTNGSGTIFSGWTGCPGMGRKCTVNATRSTTVTATFTAATANLVFVTSKSFPTNRRGAAAYDADCNAVASAAGINDAAGGAFTALISDPRSLVRNRLPATARGWMRIDGKPFADTQMGMFDRQEIFNPVIFDENGLEATDSFMTGMNPNGSVFGPQGTINNCNDWTQGEAYVYLIGSDARQGSGTWITNGTLGCNLTHPLLCVGHTKAVTVRPLVTTGRKIWLSNAMLRPGPSAGSPDALCQASRPSGVTTAAALLAYTTRSAASLLDPTANYVRPDGTLVGTGKQIASTPSMTFSPIGLTSGIWQYGSGAYTLEGLLAWTGQLSISALGTTASTCGNWTDPTQIGTNGDPTTTQSHWWGWDSTASCGETRFIYCVQTVP